MNTEFFAATGFDKRPPRAVIYGIEGLELTPEEQVFFAVADPFGFILFARNCEKPDQIKRLVSSLKEVCRRDSLPILIDQEGGRVARLTPPHWSKIPAAGKFAAIAQRDGLEKAKNAVYQNARLIARELKVLGINVNCAPVADLLHTGADGVIGDRAYGSDPQQAGELAQQMAQGLLDGGVLPVIKHIPGHGRAGVDSHKDLPLVDSPLDELARTDFVPFVKLKDMPLAMTAHILYTALDSELPATLSPTVINIIRDKIGFKGVLMSDDIAMKALKGDIGDLAKQTLTAGCDIVLHCNGKLKEMKEIADVVPIISKNTIGRTKMAFTKCCSL